VPSDFHARHSTIAKTYEYRVYLERPPHSPDRTFECPPFLARYVYSYPWPLDFEALQESARLFVGTQNFLSFAATDPGEATRSGDKPTANLTGDEEETGRPGAIRTVFGSSWDRQESQHTVQFIYRVRGSGFLHHMVRNMVGTMLDVGRGYRQAEDIPGMISARSRAAAGPTAPARGLFLHSVEYPPEA
jgi:tRNA pseudouridine38-40 synthase